MNSPCNTSCGREEIGDRLRTYIRDNFLYRSSVAELSDCDSLIENRVIDSFGILSLVVEVEVMFGISVHDTDVTVENFDSIERITTFIARKLAS